MNSDDSLVFDESLLRMQIVGVWGAHGAHIDVYDSLVRERDLLRAELREANRAVEKYHDALRSTVTFVEDAARWIP